MIPLFTSRYQNVEAIINSGLVPVRTSVGAPRWKLPYATVALPALYPERSWLKLDMGPYIERYVAKLDDNWATIERELERLSREHGGDGLVLLCYEDLATGWCHRRIFAEWMSVNHGVEVAEL